MKYLLLVALITLQGCSVAGGKATCPKEWTGARALNPRDISLVFSCEAITNTWSSLSASGADVWNELEDRMVSVSSADNSRFVFRHFDTKDEAIKFVSEEE